MAAAILIATLLNAHPAAADPPPEAPSSTYAALRTGADSRSIDRLYQAFFLRAPDADGLAYWRGLVAGGRPLSAVALQFSQSAEFRSRYGAVDDNAFVDLVYRNVMGRDADAAGRAHWTGVLSQRRLSRGGVMLSFSDSAEYKAKTGLVGSSTDLQVTTARAGYKELVVIDRTGRNASARLPALAERRSYVHVRFPTDAAGRPITDRALPLHVIGAYRNGPTPTCNAHAHPHAVIACLGFARQDHQTGIQWGDMANNPGDVSALLDHLIADQTLAGRIDTARIVYSGSSMAGISGLYFAHPDFADPRIRAVHANVAFAPFAIPEITDPVAWRPSPAILMTNAMDDTDITYELARRTYTAAGTGRVTFVTARSGGHAMGCDAVWAYASSWLDQHLLDGPAPAAPSASGCAVLGVQEGGTQGYGLAQAFRRR